MNSFSRAAEGLLHLLQLLAKRFEVHGLALLELENSLQFSFFLLRSFQDYQLILSVEPIARTQDCGTQDQNYYPFECRSPGSGKSSQPSS